MYNRFGGGLSDACFTDSDDSTSTAPVKRVAQSEGYPEGIHGADGGDVWGILMPGKKGEEGVAAAAAGEEREAGGLCDIYLEAVSTGGMQEELMGTVAVEVSSVIS